MDEEITQPVEDELEEKDVEVMEFSLDEDEIDELVAKLRLLKEEKTSFNFDVDDENELLVHYDSEDQEEDDEEGGSE